MPFGKSVTTFLTDFLPDDHLAPQVTSAFVHALPPSPIKGAAVSAFVHELFPTDPVHPTGLGSDLSEFIHSFRGPDLGDGGPDLGDGGRLSQDNYSPDNGFVASPLGDYFVFG